MLDLNNGWWTRITPEKLEERMSRHPDLFEGLRLRRYAVLLEAGGEWSSELHLYVAGDAWSLLEPKRHTLERTLREWLGHPGQLFISYALDSSGYAVAGREGSMN